jgi:cold shock CspA family protein
MRRPASACAVLHDCVEDIMKGKLKFVDGKTATWGFIIPDDGSPDLHFVQRDVVGNPLVRSQAGVDLEFDVDDDSSGRHARRVRLLASAQAETTGVDVAPAPIPEPRAFLTRTSPGDELSQWAYMVFADFVNRDGRTVNSHLHQLAKMALEERWFFGEVPDARNPYPILENYVKFTFFRLRRESKVAEVDGSGGKWAAFNTGLVDKLYDPIFALFEENDRTDLQPWRFDSFCVPGKGRPGKQLTAVFDPLPEPASYFQSNFDMLLDTSKDIHVDYDHVILDGVSRDRFPPDFVAQHQPRSFAWKDYTALDRNDREQYLTELAKAIENDVQTMRAIKRRLEDAKLLAEKRTRWNYKTAIPQYFPRQDVMSLLLPLAIVDDEKVDLALVVTRNPSGSYQGRTVFPLDWAYQNARLVCRPDSDWLVTEHITKTSIVLSPPVDA